uniref:PUM-HD domain-containing protein n=1 Tax=Anopheles christyi TaxID=43041 RepID=A0A182K091_9DIPT
MAAIKQEIAEGSTAEPTEWGKNHYKNRAKKHKRNKFLKNAKSFGKRESFGHGAELERNEYNYLVAILETMTKEKDNEERQLIATNVMGQLKGKEIRTASNQVGCRIMEDLLAYTDEETFAGLMETFAQNFRVFCCEKFASHVLQRTLYVALLRAVAPLQEDQQQDDAEGEDAQQSVKKHKPGAAARGDKSVWPCYEYCLKEQYGDEHRAKCRQFVERMAKYLINNLEEFVWDVTAAYVIRQCLLNLSGITEKKMEESSDTKHLIVPEQWYKLLHEFNLNLMAWPQFSDLIGMEQTSTILQDLVRALASTNDTFQLEQLIAKLFKEVFYSKKIKKEEKDEEEQVKEEQEDEKSDLPKAFQNESSIRLLEVCIVVAPATFLKDKLYTKLFRGHVKQLALSRACNFAVQKLIDHTTDKDMMDMIFSELEDGLEDLLRIGHTGVVLVLAKACARLSCQQGKFVKNLLDALHCAEVAPVKMINAVLYLLPGNVIPATTPKILIHGSLILQTILDFNKPIKFVNALLDMPNDRLAEILSDPCGSFIANAFVKGRFVGEKSREKLVRHLEGQYSQLVFTVHGSRVVEILYEAGNPAQRENIVRELAEQCERLNGKPWSAKVNKRLLVDLYQRNPARWKVAIKNDAKVEKMFDKLVGGKKRKAET